jgi:DMSO/TMAO reductase YedYZ molybdopterin-dependent catalytic subunit
VSVTPRRYAALAGGVAALTGIAVSHALTALVHARATPVQAVAEQVIARTPGPVAETLIGVVGRKDKPILVATVTVAVIALGALAGVLAARRPWLGNLVLVAMAVVALLAVMAGPGFTPFAVLPLGAGTATWLVLLAWLVDAAGPRAGDEAVDPGRRTFLLKAGGTAAVALVVAASGGLLGRARQSVEAARRALRLPVTAGTVPAGAQLGPTGTTSWRVPNDAFYRIDTALVVPTVDPAQWRLRIHGMVDRELTVGYRDLLQRRLTEAWVTLCCVSNPVGGDLIGNAWWSGVRIADLLAAAGVRPGPDAVKQTSKDGWTCGTPVEALTDDRNALLAVAMNGRPLPLEHGFPVRMVVPGLFGFVSATKWLVDLEVTRFADFTAYWTDRGWSAQAPVKTESRIEVPRSGAKLAAGRVRVGGHAWAQHTGIEQVEVRLDGHAWQPTELGRVPGNDTWVQWAATVEAPAGAHTLAVRATDRSGYTQTAARADVVPDGATGWHTVPFSTG